jgi:hypothetical protein
VQILHQLKYESPEEVAITRFQDVVTQPEAMMRALWLWLGLPDDPKNLSGHTPNYGMRGFDSDKAESTALDSRLLPSPATTKLYEELTAQALAPATHTSTPSTHPAQFAS